LKLRKINHLQTLRGVAALVVAADHALEYPIRRHALSAHWYQLAWCLGWAGVATFFAISGFIMIRSSYGDFGAFSRAKDFALRRIIRVVPFYWLVMIPYAVSALARRETVTSGMVLKTLFFIPYYSVAQGAMRPIVGQGWTLDFEMLFYTLFALCLILRRRLGIALLLAVFPAMVVLRTFVWPLVPYADATTPLQFWTDPITLLFVAGAMVGLVEVRLGQWHNIPYPVVLSLGLFGGAIGAFLMLGGRFPMPISWQALFGIAATLSVILCTSGEGRRLSRVGRLAEATGDASYSTYLIHPLVLMVMATVWDHLHTAPGYSAVFVALAVLACGLAGYVSYLFVERPLTNRLLILRSRYRAKKFGINGFSQVQDDPKLS
jgi:exopolysaccharide production protein ExoZ